MRDVELPLPGRVLAIAGVILVGLALLWWFATSSPPQPSVEAEPDEERTTGGQIEEKAPPDSEAEAEPRNASSGKEGEGEAEASTGEPEVGSGSDPEADGSAGEPPGGPLPAGVTGETVTFSLYYVENDSRGLTRVVRRHTVPATLAAKAHAAVRLLAESPPRGKRSPFPDGTRVREVWTTPGGLAYVDLSSEVRQLAGSLAEIHAVYSVVNTLIDTFPEILAVQVLVDGQESDTLVGHIDISRPLSRHEDW